jgi:hypothetical protein
MGVSRREDPKTKVELCLFMLGAHEAWTVGKNMME